MKLFAKRDEKFSFRGLVSTPMGSALRVTAFAVTALFGVDAAAVPTPLEKALVVELDGENSVEIVVDEVKIARKKKRRRVKPKPKPEEEVRPSAEDAAPIQSNSRRPSRVDFDERLIKGETNKADAIYLFERRSSEMRSLVKKRRHFHVEIDETLR